jgi:DNA-binding CsgD family transcriptional regulator
MATKFTDLDTLRERPFYCLGDKTAELCTPLFSNFPINYFCYGRIYTENNKINSFIVTHSNKNWFRYFCQSQYKFIITRKKIHTWSSTMESKAQKEAGVIFGAYNGILLEKIDPEYIEVLEFASPNLHTTPLDFCSNKELVNKFLIYFKDKAKEILKAAEKEPLYFPPNRFLKLANPDQSYDNFCQAINTQTLPLKFKSQEVVFTKREFEVLSLLIKGKNMREVGKILKISPRTVESYLYNAKDKTKSYTVSQLLEYFADSLF